MLQSAPPTFVPVIADDNVDLWIVGSGPLMEAIAGLSAGDESEIKISLGSTLVSVRGVVDMKMLTAVLKAPKVASWCGAECGLTGGIRAGADENRPVF